jgi:GNAT superfamily N-acetyltransferase
VLLGRIQAVLADGATLAWSATHADRLLGFATMQPLAWDSRILLMPAARLDLFAGGGYAESRPTADALLAVFARDVRQHGLRHVSIRVDAADDAAIHGLEAAGFLNVDALVTFAASVEQLPRVSAGDGISLRRATEADAGLVGAIAAAAFQHGRFHADPSLPRERACDVYRTWAAACCDGTAADTMIVAVDPSGPVGFVACRMLRDSTVHLQCATGTIPLIASSETVRGRGVGFALIAAAAQWFRAEQAVMVEVGTQLRNTAAARLYERCGFRVVAGSLSFRLVIES